MKRNRNRFPEDFILQLTDEERGEPVTICDRFKNLKHSSVLPYTSTEHGVVMAVSILNSQRAVEVSIYVVRAFIQMRGLLFHHKALSRKIAELEQQLTRHDSHIKSLFQAIRQLMLPPEKPRKPIGFLKW